MITDLWIENFKGIGKRQHIPLKPVTLLFGKNSAGKSTVLHALLSLREIVTNRNFELRNAVSGEQSVSLGGIERILHRTKLSQADTLTLGIAFTVPEVLRNQFTKDVEADFGDRLASAHSQYGDSYSSPAVWPWATMVSPDAYPWPVPPSSCQVEITVKSSDSGKNPNVALFRLWTDTVEFLQLECNETGQANGWVNLRSRSWGCPAYSFKMKSIDLGTLQKAYDFKCKHARTLFLEKLSTVQPEEGTTNVVRFATNILEVPVFEEHSGDLSETWTDESTVLIQINDYLLEISPYEVTTEIDDLLMLDGSQNLYVYVGEGDENSFARLIGPFAILGKDVSLQTLKAAVGVIRHYWTLRFSHDVSGRLTSESGDELGSAFQGNWTHEFVVDLNGTALPDSRVPLVPNMTPEIVPGLDVGSGDNPNYFEVVPELVDDTVNRVLRFALERLEAELQAITYVGPKRSTVPRYLSDRFAEGFSDWGNGLAAWRWLLEADVKGVEESSLWLSRLAESSNDQATSGYELVRERFREVPEDEFQQFIKYGTVPDWTQLALHARLFLLDRSTEQKLHPQEVGEGITQVIPVIAALVRASTSVSNTESHLVAIEQPELHLHPSVAAKLGDLFLATMVGSQEGQCLIETHSEHLILRILRRIRQTTDADESPEHIPQVTANDVSVLWVDNRGDGTTFQRLRIDERGEFIDRWPKGFFSERAEELY